MIDRFVTDNLQAKLAKKSLNTLVGWNRLEGRQRTTNMANALRAELHDALWMLTRQWQMGEYKGDDAGSPVIAAPIVTHSPLERFQSGTSAAQDFDLNIPFEAKVEALPLEFQRKGLSVSLDLRMQMGRHWLKLLVPLGDHKARYIELYAIDPVDPANRQHASIAAHPEALQLFSAATGRLMDGYKFYQYLTEQGGKAADGLVVNAAEADKINDLGKLFLSWFARQYTQPAEQSASAWEAERLEYRFSLAAQATGGEKRLNADEYFNGKLDWFNYDIDSDGPRLGAIAKPETRVNALLPSPLTFPGMPNTRWWAFEDGKINLGKIAVSSTDLGRMAFLEFSLLYANDWYLSPLTLPAGAAAEVHGVAVTNVFGERFWVKPAGQGIDDDWQRWTMFTNSIRGKGRAIADTGILTPPVVPKIQQGKPLDEVRLTRDEMANMVWAIECTIPLPTGRSKPGREAARELRQYFEKLVSTVPPATTPSAPLRYDVMSAVAEHWIPFVSARQEGSNRLTRLQRGSMLRIIEGEQGLPHRIVPRTGLLRQGLDFKNPEPYFLEEEEVPRAGLKVTRAFRRTRWRFGQTFVWLGAQKVVGRGEGNSGLTFDRLVKQDMPTDRP
jgi:hypothetical protein